MTIEAHRLKLVAAVAVALAAADAVRSGGWDDRFNLRGMDGEVLALVADGTDIYAAGTFGTAGTAVAQRVARWDGTSWTPLGSGVSDDVHALAWDGSSLYVAGAFTLAGGVAANHIARWDGTSWLPLASGLNDTAVALAWDGSSLFVGGYFTMASGVSAKGIARWDGTRWNPLGTGVDGSVRALAWNGSSLFAAGSFWTAGGVPARSIARWDGTQWSPVGSGLASGVFALAWDGSRLYAGGGFTTGSGAPADYIARWDGASWTPLGGGTNGYVHALSWDGSALQVGGAFTEAGGVAAGFLARWDGTGWSPLPDGGANNTILSLAWDGSSLYAGGYLTEAGNVHVAHVARFDGVSYSSMPTTGDGLNGLQASGITSLAWEGSSLYAGGWFTLAGGEPALCVARWNETGWSPLDTGMDDTVWTLAWDGSSLYAGGWFTSAGGIPASYVARWNGTTWSSLGSGMDSGVLALAWDGSGLYAAGTFGTAGGVPANRVARWDGTSWRSLGNGIGGGSAMVNALEWDGARLYAGGLFATAGGAPASNVARWDGASWSSLGSGIGGSLGSVVHTLAWDGASLYAGGSFATAGGIPASNIARWDGAAWSSVGGGAMDTVLTLAWDGESLYAGGSFMIAGGVTANRIARWDGATWSTLGGGMDRAVYALEPAGTGMFVGGNFSSAGGKASTRIARWGCPEIPVGPAALPAATSGASYVAAFTATGGTSPYTFAVTSGSAPPGLSLSPSGVLAGTPTTPGTYAFTVTAVDADTCTGSVDLVLLVNPPGCPAIAITPASLPDAQLGAPYAQTLTATGGTAPHTFSVGAGPLPPGLTLSLAGVLSGTPTASGTFPFTIAATDASGCAGIQPYALVVSTGAGNVLAGAGLGPPSPNRVKLFAAGLPTGTDFLAYGAGSWGASVATGDLGADPRRVDQIVTGPGPGPVLGPHVRAFLREGTALAKVSYYAYGTLRYGVNPGAAALDADTFDEILTGAGAGAVFGPHVRGFNFDGAALTAISKVSYFAYGTLRYGVNVHRGDVDADGFAEILTGPGPGPTFGPQVRGFDYDGTAVASIPRINFQAFPSPGYGVNLAGGSVDTDAFDELACATGPGPAFTPDLRAFGYDASSVTTLPGFAVTLSTGTRYGGRVGLGDVTGDAVAELLAGKGRDSGADARISRYAYTGASLQAMPWIDAFPGGSYGVTPAGMEGGF